MPPSSTASSSKHPTTKINKEMINKRHEKRRSTGLDYCSEPSGRHPTPSRARSTNASSATVWTLADEYFSGRRRLRHEKSALCKIDSTSDNSGDSAPHSDRTDWSAPHQAGAWLLYIPAVLGWRGEVAGGSPARAVAAVDGRRAGRPGNHRGCPSVWRVKMGHKGVLFWTTPRRPNPPISALEVESWCWHSGKALVEAR